MILMMKYVGIFILALFSLAFVSAQSSTPAPKKDGVAKPVLADAILPGKEDVDAALKRTFGYDPSITWEIYDIRSSVIPGMTE